MSMQIKYGCLPESYLQDPVFYRESHHYHVIEFRKSGRVIKLYKMQVKLKGQNDQFYHFWEKLSHTSKMMEIYKRDPIKGEALMRRWIDVVENFNLQSILNSHRIGMTLLMQATCQDIPSIVEYVVDRMLQNRQIKSRIEACFFAHHAHIINAYAFHPETLHINQVDDLKNNALHCLCNQLEPGERSSAVDIIQKLYVGGIDLNAQDLMGDTALHVAASKGLVSIVRTLIELGADTTIKNLADETSYETACMQEQPYVASMLI